MPAGRAENPQRQVARGPKTGRRARLAAGRREAAQAQEEPAAAARSGLCAGRGAGRCHGARLPVAPAPDAAETGGGRRAGAPAGDGPFYAALDLGTNNCRLLVATPRDHGFRVVDAFSRIVRLGEGIGANGRLSEAAMVRAIEALQGLRPQARRSATSRAPA